MDTVASEGSWEAALRGSGAACDAVERLLRGEDRAAFCALRPPGHHAERDRAMGFCLTNHVAAAAEHARTLGAERVLILDWDVHHGNGTEDIFKASSDVLYASIHEWPLYPGTGDISYAGEGAGEGYTVNLPVPAGSGDDAFHGARRARCCAACPLVRAGADRDLGGIRRSPRRSARVLPRDRRGVPRDGGDDGRRRIRAWRAAPRLPGRRLRHDGARIIGPGDARWARVAIRRTSRRQTGRLPSPIANASRYSAPNT